MKSVKIMLDKPLKLWRPRHVYYLANAEEPVSIRVGLLAPSMPANTALTSCISAPRENCQIMYSIWSDLLPYLAYPARQLRTVDALHTWSPVTCMVFRQLPRYQHRFTGFSSSHALTGNHNQWSFHG